MGKQASSWTVTADRWHVGFVDLSGGQGLLAQVEGRTTAAVTGWLTKRPQAWREQVQAVAIDMCTVFKAAVGQVLPRRWSSTASTSCIWPTGPSPRSAGARRSPGAGAAAGQVIRNGGCVTG